MNDCRNLPLMSFVASLSRRLFRPRPIYLSNSHLILSRITRVLSDVARSRRDSMDTKRCCILSADFIPSPPDNLFANTLHRITSPTDMVDSSQFPDHDAGYNELLSLTASGTLQTIL